jgi:chemotaxis protein MotB
LQERRGGGSSGGVTGMADETKAPIIIKKKIIHAGHHGGAWKVAYADFVTALMALFIVLWLMNSKEEVKQAVGGYFKDPSGTGKLLGTNMNGTGRDLNVNKDDMSQLKEKLKAILKVIPHFDLMKGNVELTITEEGLRIELLENDKGMFFVSGSPKPTSLGTEILTALAGEIGKLPNKIAIEGHTDASPYAGEEYSNWELSSDRANQARRILVHAGVNWHQIAQVRGYADQDLHDQEHPSSASNRRVSVIVKYMEEQKVLKIPLSPGVGATPNRQPEVKTAPTPAPKK